MRASPNAAAAASGGGRRMDLCEQASAPVQHTPSASCFPSVNNTGIVFERTSVTSAVNDTGIVFKRTTNIDDPLFPMDA